ncbi:MAG: ATP-binding protein, partial [Aphanizomenon sp.]
ESKIKQMKKTAATFSLLEELIKYKGGENVDLIEDQIRPLIAILAIYQKRQNYQLTEEQIFDIISKNNITFDNLLLREILSDPSGEMPDIDDEDIIDEFLTPSNINETEDTDDLSDLLG